MQFIIKELKEISIQISQVWSNQAKNRFILCIRNEKWSISHVTEVLAKHFCSTIIAYLVLFATEKTI